MGHNGGMLMGNKKVQRITVGVIIGVIVISLALSLISTASATPASRTRESAHARDARAAAERAQGDRRRFCPGPGRLLTFPLVAPLAQLAEQVTLNHWVRGSSPWRRTNFAGQEPGPLGRALLLSTKPPTFESGASVVRASSSAAAAAPLLAPRPM